MQALKSIRFFVIGVLGIIVWYSCVNHDLYESKPNLEINLRWIKGHRQESRDEVIKGLAWNMSYLGAALPKGSLSAAIAWKRDDVFTLRMSLLGFSKKAENAISELLSKIRESEEYVIHNAIDIGRFTALTLNSSNHYYAITGAEPNLQAYTAKYLFASKKGAIVSSSVTKGNRLVSIATGSTIHQIAFIAAEGNGTIADGTFEEVEYETLDIMPNGQLRFALYDKNGKLKLSASPELTEAGKPAKCLWCHEINLQALNEMESVVGYYSYEEFKNIIDDKRKLIETHRTTLHSEIDFSRKQDHTFGELLYISFMEPSAFRLAQEWLLTEAEVKSLLTDFPSHAHHEFPFLGDALFDRVNVDALAPYGIIHVPENAREYSMHEPEIIKP